MASPEPLFVYTALIYFLLIGLTLIVQNKFSFWLCILLVLLYTLFMIFLFMHKKKTPYNKIHTIDEFHKTNERPKWIHRFEQEAQNIMSTIRAEQSRTKGETIRGDSSFHSPNSYSAQNQLPTLLKSAQILDHNQSFRSTNNHMMVSYCNTSFWKRQLKQISDNFTANMKDQSSMSINYDKSDIQYIAILQNLGISKQNLPAIQNIVQQFLYEKSNRVIDRVQPLIVQANQIISKHFMLTLTNGQTANPNEISLQQLKNIVKFFSNHKYLPQKYNSKFTKDKISTDMERLVYLYYEISNIIVFPEQFQPFFILTKILKEQFPSETIQINKVELAQKKNANVYILMVQIDYIARFSTFPQYRTKNCKKLANIFMFSLIKKGGRTTSKVLRHLKTFVQ